MSDIAYFTIGTTQYSLKDLFARQSISDLIDWKDDVANWIDNFLDTFYPVGSYYETSDTSFDPNITWGGTWVLETEGQVHVSAGANYTVGDTGGTTIHTHTTGNHTLTVNEIPSHSHVIEYAQYNRGTGSATATALQYSGSAKSTNSTGGGQAHNHGDTGSGSNMQPYIVVNRWHRTA